MNEIQTYLEEDGLLHCAVCKEPVEAFYPKGSSGRPLITTTNLPLVQLKQETKIGKKRIYDRILERCIPVKIDGVSRREAMANDNMQTMKNILKI